MPKLEYTKITFEAEIRLTAEEIAAGEGNLEQAVQNEIGHTGAVVTEVIDSWNQIL